MVSRDIVARKIGGLPVLSCSIHFGDNHIEANLMFDLSLGVALQMHEKSVGGLGLIPEVAPGQKVRIEFAGGVALTGIPITVTLDPLLQEHTRLFAEDLKEVPVIGFIGLPAFSSSVIELDLGRELLRMMGMASDEARAKEMPYERKACGMVVKGTGPAGASVEAALATRSHDLVLAPSLLRAAREKGARPNVLTVGDVAFGDRSATRFEVLDETWPEEVNAVIGAEALRNCTVTIWPERGKIAMRGQPTTPFPENEQKYFFALADRDAGAVSAFIASTPRRRLLDEACLALWRIGLEDSRSSLEVLKASMETIADNYHLGRRTETLMRIAEELEGTRHQHREELVDFALELAIRESPSAVENTAVHDVHVRLGRRALAKGDLKRARRHLLSAAFGMPKNGECNYWLGEAYRLSGKLRRAWSRYFQAILYERWEEDDPLLDMSFQRLDELNRDPEFRKTFNMVMAEQYMAGRLADFEFHAQSRYRYVKDRHPGHVRLVELFVDSSDFLGGGMELAFQSLDEFFEGEIALIAYHLKDPMHSEASRERLRYYAKRSVPLAVFDGAPVLDTDVGQGESLAEDAAMNCQPFLNASLVESPVEDFGWRVDGVMTNDGAILNVDLVVQGEGDAEGARLHVVLCERSVMAVEDNGVYFHHFVARDVLTPNEGILLKDGIEARPAFRVDVAQLGDKTEAKLPALHRAGDGRAPLYIDANQLIAVAFVQRSADRRILAVGTFGLPQEDEF